jgi:cytochrome o ubiquinol oxidase subunit 1
MGATRRLEHYDFVEWQPLFIIAFIGALIIFAGMNVQLLQLVISIRNKDQLKDTTGDPWNGRTLEWTTTSPPPFYNFAHTPTVTSRDDFWVFKQQKKSKPVKPYESIHMPSNTPYGFLIGNLAFFFGFGLIWQMYWMAIGSALLILIFSICPLYQKNREYDLSQDIIRAIESGEHS